MQNNDSKATGYFPTPRADRVADRSGDPMLSQVDDAWRVVRMGDPAPFSLDDSAPAAAKMGNPNRSTAWRQYDKGGISSLIGDGSEYARSDYGSPSPYTRRSRQSPAPEAQARLVRPPRAGIDMPAHVNHYYDEGGAPRDVSPRTGRLLGRIHPEGPSEGRRVEGKASPSPTRGPDAYVSPRRQPVMGGGITRFD